MIIGFIANLLLYTGMKAKLAGWIARGAVLLAIVGALYAAYSWAYNRGEADERAKWEAAAEILKDADTAADAEALDVAAETKGTIDATNQRAADAAAQSDDPLAAATERLRAEGAGRGGKTTR